MLVDDRSIMELPTVEVDRPNSGESPAAAAPEVAPEVAPEGLRKNEFAHVMSCLEVEKCGSPFGNCWCSPVI